MCIQTYLHTNRVVFSYTTAKSSSCTQFTTCTPAMMTRCKSELTIEALKGSESLLLSQPGSRSLVVLHSLPLQSTYLSELGKTSQEFGF